MSFLERLRKSDATVASALAAVLPGESSGMVRLRRDAQALALDPLARGALILGPAGAGKSTLARTIALCRYLGSLTPARAKAFLETVRADGPFRISARSLDWYIEFSLPGLAVSVAEAQLFGFTEDVTQATRGSTRARHGASPSTGGRPSIFERAALGQGADDASNRTQGARVTGGVVFLDEVGDLDESLQPKLLAVLTGAPCYRVGGEGREDANFVFDGLTIAATWRPLGRVRPDLVARLQDHVLRIPSLSERHDELDELAGVIIAEIRSEYERWWAPQAAASETLGIDRQRFETTLERVRKFRATPELFASIQRVDWRRLGELRGLHQVLRRVILSGQTVEDVVAAGSMEPNGDRDSDPLLDAMFALPMAGARGVGDALEHAAAALRLRTAAALQRDDELAARVAEHVGVPLEVLRRQVSDLKRRAVAGGDIAAGRRRSRR